jgi:hypothetical protein
VITTTLGRLVNAVPTLHRIAAVPLPMRTAYDLAKLVKLVEVEVDIFNDRVEALRKELRGDLPADADVPVPADVLAAFQERVNDLTAVPVTIDWKPFNLSVLEDRKDAKGQPIELTSQDLILLDVNGPHMLAVLPEPPNPAETQEEKSI